MVMGDCIEPFLVRIAEDLDDGEGREPGRRFLGTGFQVAPGAFVTCRHVVCPKDPHFATERRPPISVGFPNGTWRRAGRVPDAEPQADACGTGETPTIHLATSADLAVIRLDSKHSCSQSARLCRGIPLGAKDALDRVTLRAPGFAGPQGVPNEGKGFRLLATFDDAVGQSRVQVEAGLDHGMSGCPVLLECQPGVGDAQSGTSFVVGVLRLGSEFAGNSSWTSVDRLAALLDQLGLEPQHGYVHAPCLLAANALAALDRLGDPSGAPMEEFLERGRNFVGRDWLIQTLDRWATPEGTPGLRVEGGPGVGKSALAAKLVLRSRDGSCRDHACSIVAHHVCDARGNTRSIDAGSFVRHIASQLAWGSTALADACFAGASPLLSHLRLADEQAMTAWRKVLQAIQGTSPPPILLVDGLDLAADNAMPGKDSIVDLLAEASKGGEGAPKSVRLLVTCQGRSAIEEGLNSFDCLRLSPDEARQVDDVTAFTVARLGNTEAAKRLGEQANGNFYFATLLLRDLEATLPAGTSPDTTRQALNRAVTAWLDSPCELPRRLTALYHNLFERHFPRDDADRWNAAEAILGLLLASAEPLPLPLLRSALTAAHFATRDIEEAIGELAAFATIRADRINIDHDSVRRWLQIGGDAENVRPHAFSIAARIVKESHVRLCDAIDALPAHNASHSCLKYAARHHAHHLVEAGRLVRLGEILLDGRRLRDRLAGSSVAEVLREYSTYLNCAPAGAQTAPHVQVRDALSLSDSVLRHQPHHLASQMMGRLAKHRSAEIATFLKSLADTEPGPWLRPLDASLTCPGDVINRGLPRGDRAVTAIALATTGGQPFVLWVGYDGVVKARPLAHWAETRPLCTHDGGVIALTALDQSGQRPDLRFATAGFDGSLRLWRLDAKKWTAREIAPQVVPSGKPRIIASLGEAVAGVPALVVGDQRGAVSVWTPRSGADADGALRPLGHHQGWVNAVTVIPATEQLGHALPWIASGGIDGVVRLWRLHASADGCEETRALGGPGPAVRALLVTPWFIAGGKVLQTLLAVHVTGEVRVWSLSADADPIGVFRLPCVHPKAVAGHPDWPHLLALDRVGHVQAVPLRLPPIASTGFFADGLASQVCVVSSKGIDGASGHLAIIGDHAGDLHRLAVEPGRSSAAPQDSRPSKPAVPPPPRR